MTATIPMPMVLLLTISKEIATTIATLSVTGIAKLLGGDKKIGNARSTTDYESHDSKH